MKTYLGPILGFRLWFSSPPILSSTGIGAGQWEPGINRAHCIKKKHKAPEHNCTCGIYALRTLAEARAHRRSLLLELGPDIPGGGGTDLDARSLAALDQETIPDFAPHCVLGAVAGSGRTEVYWNGWRAEEVQILGFLSPPGANYSEISEHYGVDTWEEANEFETAMRSVAGEIDLEIDPPIDEKTLDQFEKTYHKNPAQAREIIGDDILASDLALHLGLNPEA